MSTAGPRHEEHADEISRLMTATAASTRAVRVVRIEIRDGIIIG
jgi:hypothetical protein